MNYLFICPTEMSCGGLHAFRVTWTGFEQQLKNASGSPVFSERQAEDLVKKFMTREGFVIVRGPLEFYHKRLAEIQRDADELTPEIRT